MEEVASHKLQVTSRKKKAERKNRGMN